eukprot:CAMPEP_0170651976 /NCGR_PEP_ID=MMETSP0224-20130122/46656_1 /TAXON_ID=285029 /ORGANISM="Togula jolla, Strain CCCM 725" /LENGTH=152 /DNA_ID=CAMNT_0010983807 /DNA_START=132 /DNA_END=586 /DNA_ORIENTATION=+
MAVEEVCEGLQHDELNVQLLYAAESCDLAQVQALLARGASVRYIEDRSGGWGSSSRRGVLHAAIRSKPSKLSCETAGSSGILTAPHKFEEKMKEWKLLVETLVKAGADVNEEIQESDWRGNACIRTAFEMVLPFLIQDHSLHSLLELFLSAG